MPAPYICLQLEESPRYEDAPTTTPYAVGATKYFFPVTSAQLTRGPQHMSRADEQRGSYAEPPRLIDGYQPGGSIEEFLYSSNMVPLLHIAGLAGTVQAGAGVNEVNTISQGGVWTGGTFTLTCSTIFATPSGPIQWNTTAAQMQLVLVAAWGKGNVECAGGPLPGSPITVKFVGDHSAKVLATLTAVSSLTGTAPVVTIAKTTTGSVGAVVDPDGLGVATGAYLWTFAKRTAATPRTGQIVVAYEPHAVYRKGQGYAVDQFTINAAGQFTSSLMGLVLKEAADPVYTPVYDSLGIRPLRKGDFSLTWGPAGTANTDEFSFQMQNQFERSAFYDGTRSYFPKLIEFSGEPSVLTGSIHKRTADVDDMLAELNADTFAASAMWRGESKVATSGARHSAFLKAPSCQFVGGDIENLANRNRFGMPLEWFAAHDETAGYDFRISVICALSAIDYP